MVSDLCLKYAIFDSADIYHYH